MVKRILRWFLFGGILFFLVKTLKDHWQEVRSLEISSGTLPLLTIALGITLIAHIWSGWVWHIILKTIGQPRDGRWSTVVYLKTNIAKYLPGNVWHFYGRVRALQTSGSSTGAAIVGVLLEPVLMAAAALGLAAICFSFTMASDWRLLVLALGAMIAMLVAIHPRFLNPFLRKLGKAKARDQGLTVITSTLRLQTYPWRSLLGEFGFVFLRGLGFIMTIVALQALKPGQFMPVMGAFSIAWLMGLVVPGAPGGLGVFEAVAIALLGHQIPTGLLISSVALYRLLSTLAEALGAGLIWIEDRIADFMQPMAKAKKRLLLLEPAKEGPLQKEDTQPETATLKKAGPLQDKDTAPKDTAPDDSPRPKGDTLTEADPLQEGNTPQENETLPQDDGLKAPDSSLPPPNNIAPAPMQSAADASKTAGNIDTTPKSQTPIHKASKVDASSAIENPSPEQTVSP